MNKEKISELITVANNLVDSQTGKSLTDVQKRILQQVMEGKKLKDIQVTGYSDSTVQRVFCPKLWELLSEATKQKVRINTIILVLDKILKQKSGSNNESEIAIPIEAVSVPPPVIPKRLRHNLPAPSCTTFIGREEEIARLLELLSPRHSAHLVSVDGIGGVGKTTLVVEAAYRCLNASDNNEAFLGVPTFDTIIFTSAKQYYLTSFGLLPSLAPRRTLRDIFRQIARMLDQLDITGASFEEQLDLIKDALSYQRTLLIVDNLETVENQQDVLAFLYELPPTVKAVITTREQIVFVPVRLTSMPEKDGVCLIQHEAQSKGVSLRHQDQMALYHVTGGIPVAISYAIGQLANGYPIQEVLERVSHSKGDVARFCFENSVKPLSEQSAHQLLMALALFPMPALQDALVQVAVPDADSTINNDLARLRGLSLVRQENHRYSMLPLTREYALAELKAHPNFEREARERWIGWYLSFSQKYFGQDAKEWQQFDGLDLEWQNLQAVIEWCMVEGRYAEMLKFWQNIEAYTHIMGRRESRLRYWDDRLTWTAWLIQAAEQRGDWLAAAKVIVDRAWTLTSMGKQKHLLEADSLFAQAWELRHHQEPLFRLSLARNIAVLRIQQQRFDEAQQELTQAIELLEQTQLEEQQRLEQLVQIRYYQGEIFFKKQEYSDAKILFQEALELAQSMDWRRAIFCTQNWLADIAIKQGRLDEADRLLKQGLRVAEANGDKCRSAFCQRSLSSLAKAQGNLVSARSWAYAAVENFEKLGMLPEVEETQILLQTL
ncbi:AAA family ATPase [Iningainema tapete]|uniref:AAA family ATPase n=1 Tax=Iningainema tapete BLCC-T55 TaxID=2748662 RepID=A0A8J7C760_9CYAN|nr:AAA family ATPase [Iningainema tapete]MBD2775244.1 AAA family ATPase [Iningainema tapete BLCC-T55]